MDMDLWILSESADSIDEDMPIKGAALSCSGPEDKAEGRKLGADVEGSFS